MITSAEGHSNDLIDRWRYLRASPIGVDYVVKDYEIIGHGIFRRNADYKFAFISTRWR